MSTCKILTGDCLEAMKTIPDSSIDLILTDPPYYRVKGEAWDRQWDTPDLFIEWIGKVAAEWYRLLKPNGSLYCFASPKMSARVEVEIGRRFNVLNRIRWQKPEGWHHKAVKEELRSYLSPWEEIIFAEHYGSDNIAKGEGGYVAKCDELRGFVFEPLREYLASERDRAGWTTRRVAEEYQKVTGSRTVTGMAGHWFERVQWTLPTEKNYTFIRNLFNQNGGEYLRREYEDLRREYEDLRRPFTVTDSVPYTDAWTFKTVGTYGGKHPCEKPQAMLRHIIRASSRPGATVLDSFVGGGSTGVACVAEGRDFIGCELSAEWAVSATRKIRTSAGLFRKVEFI